MSRKRGNILVIVLAALLLVSVSAAGYFYWQTQQKAPTPKSEPENQQTNSPSSGAQTKTPIQQEPQKFVFHEEIVVKPTKNILTDRGNYTSQFVVYDISSKSKTIFGEHSYNDDRADSYKLYQDKYVLTISPQGNSITAINPSESTPSFPAGYDSSHVSPSGKKRITTNFPQTSSATVTLTVTDTLTNQQKTYPIQTKDLVPQFIGWSSDEKYIYYILIQTEAGDPGMPIYQLNTETGQVIKIGRDPSIGKFSNLGLKLGNDNQLYFAADNGVWVEKIGEPTAKTISLTSLDTSRKQYYRILPPLSENTGEIAISDGNKLIIKDLNNDSETLIATALPGGSIEPISWKSNSLIYIHDKQGSNGTEKENGYFIVGEIYNLGSKTTTEFFNHKSFDMFQVGRFEFVDWLQ